MIARGEGAFQLGQFGFRPGMPLFGGFAEPVDRFLHILGYALTFAIVHTQTELRPVKALFGGRMSD